MRDNSNYGNRMFEVNASIICYMVQITFEINTLKVRVPNFKSL